MTQTLSHETAKSVLQHALSVSPAMQAVRVIDTSGHDVVELNHAAFSVDVTKPSPETGKPTFKEPVVVQPQPTCLSVPRQASAEALGGALAAHVDALLQKAPASKNVVVGLCLDDVTISHGEKCDTLTIKVSQPMVG